MVKQPPLSNSWRMLEFWQVVYLFLGSFQEHFIFKINLFPMQNSWFSWTWWILKVFAIIILLQELLLQITVIENAKLQLIMLSSTPVAGIGNELCVGAWCWYLFLATKWILLLAVPLWFYAHSCKQCKSFPDATSRPLTMFLNIRIAPHAFVVYYCWTGYFSQKQWDSSSLCYSLDFCWNYARMNMSQCARVQKSFIFLAQAGI